MSISNHSFNGSGYLEATVRSASPARLRLMLIEGAGETAARLIASWQAQQSLGANEHSLKLLDLLTELLSGVTGGTTVAEQQLCAKIADLYVFLAKHLVAAEQSSDCGAIDEIKRVLAAEAETWRAVCAQESSCARGESR